MKMKICPKCGASNSSETTWCTNCSSSLAGAREVERGVADGSEDHLSFEPDLGRPLFVVILLMFGFICAWFVSLATFGLVVYISLATEAFNLSDSAILALFGTIPFLISIFCIIMFYGLKYGKRWIWKLEIVLLLIGLSRLIYSFEPINIVQIVIIGLIFILLMLPGTRAYFDSFQQRKKLNKKVIVLLFILPIIVFAGLFFAFQADFQNDESEISISFSVKENYIVEKLDTVGKNYNSDTGYTDFKFYTQNLTKGTSKVLVECDFDFWKKGESIYFGYDENDNWICSKTNDFTKNITIMNIQFHHVFNEEGLYSKGTFQSS